MVTALHDGTWIFHKTCIREKKKRGDLHQLFYGTWVADFMLRQDARRIMLGNLLSTRHEVAIGCVRVVSIEVVGAAVVCVEVVSVGRGCVQSVRGWFVRTWCVW